MLYYLKLLSIVLAVSVDSFGVGMTYGLRNIRLSPAAIGVIMACSGIIIVLSMTIGNVVRSFLPPAVTSAFGSILLISIGLFILFSSFHTSKKSSPKKQDIKKTARKRLLPHFQAILHKPESADKDRSGTISYSEAFILGTALALDAFGAGLGAALLGYPLTLTAILIALASGIFIFSGSTLGTHLARYQSVAKLTYVPPSLLICIGVFNLFS